MNTLTLFSLVLSHSGLLATAGLALGMLALGACVQAPADAVQLGTALNQCGSCEAMPVPRDWKLLDAMTRARGVYPTGEPYVMWDGLAPQDTRGRYRHLKSIRISGYVRITLGATNDFVSAYQLRSLFVNMFLSDAGGHDYLAGIDGRNIIDWFWFRHYRLSQPLEGTIPQNMGAGVYDFRYDLDIALVSRARGASPTEGLILLSALQSVSGNQGMRWTYRGSIPGNPTAPAGVTLGAAGVTFIRDDGQEGVDVWVEYVALDNPIADAPWGLRSYVQAEPNGKLLYPNVKTCGAMIRYFPEDVTGNAGQAVVANLDNITLTAASGSFAQTRRIDMIRRQDFLAVSAPDSAAALGLPLLNLPAEPGTPQSYLTLCPDRPRETAPAGPIVYNFATFPTTPANIRILHYFVGCDSGPRAEAILASVKCGPASCVQATNPIVNGMPALGVSDPTAPKILLPLNRVG